jgi:hypothetical protein
VKILKEGWHRCSERLEIGQPLSRYRSVLVLI